MDSAIEAIGSSAVQNAWNTSALKSFSLKGSQASDAELTATAKNFEAMFMAQMLQPMFEGLNTDNEFGGGHGEDVMRGFLVQEYGKAVAQSDTSGLSDAIKSEMIRMQEVAQGPTARSSTAAIGKSS